MEKVQAAIVGSGHGGSICAARLGQAGVKTVVLERGPRSMSASEFHKSDDPRYIETIVDVVVASDRVAFRTGTMVGGAGLALGYPGANPGWASEPRFLLQPADVARDHGRWELPVGSATLAY